ncbi:MAG TPA: peptidoglycan DD-metalloendopeptidase family protein [Gammaproteobacteria bacterium]|nr:peptidoglycan DD-metalloendopeptidase family protein [Gammaproteobacteria bacterium]
MRKQISKMLLSIGGLCSVLSPVFASTVLPKAARVPGGVAVIDLGIVSPEPPEVRYLGNRTCVLANPKQPNTWLTVVGIPLEATLGINQIEITSRNNTITKTFDVKPKSYPIERLTISDKRKVEPSAEDLAVIEKEYLETIAAYARWEYKDLKSLRLATPVKGRKSSPFGLQRIMNNIPKNAHSGLDIAALKGTNVSCAKDGTVINIGNYFYSGNIVFVDHGQGFITSYCHLDTIAVQKGQELKQGDVVGTVGKTGRATGPHLHWSVSLNGVRVDPQLFISE